MKKGIFSLLLLLLLGCSQGDYTLRIMYSGSKEGKPKITTEEISFDAEDDSTAYYKGWELYEEKIFTPSKLGAPAGFDVLDKDGKALERKNPLRF